MRKVKVIDKKNNFREVIELDFELAAALNVGDHILPYPTGFSFIIIDKLSSIIDDNKEYTLTLNVKEYETRWRKFKRKVFGIKSWGYWDYVTNYTNRKIC